MLGGRWRLNIGPLRGCSGGVSRQLASKSSPLIRPRGPRSRGSPRPPSMDGSGVWPPSTGPPRSSPAVIPHGGEITCMDIYISKVDGGEVIREAPPITLTVGLGPPYISMHPEYMKPSVSPPTIQDLSPCPPPRGDLPHAPMLPHPGPLPMPPTPGRPPPCSHAPPSRTSPHAPHPGATSPMLPCSPIQDLSPCPPPRGDLPHAPMLPHPGPLPMPPTPGRPPPCSHAPPSRTSPHAPHPGATSPMLPCSPIQDLSPCPPPRTSLTMSISELAGPD